MRLFAARDGNGGVMVKVGRVGVWNVGLRNDDPNAAGEIREAAAELEQLGYGAIWLGGSPGVHHAVPILEATSRIIVATGILSIWQYDAGEVAHQHAELNAVYGGRFLLGLGASHAALVEGYQRPYSTMVEYLDRLDAAGHPKDERVLAALGPRMLALSRDRAAGAHPYLVTPEHTARAREILGAGPLLAPEVKIVLDPDPAQARVLAREHLGIYLQLPNYVRNLRRLGYSEDDVTGGGSDRLIEDVYALGDAEAARRQVTAHFDAGAGHAVLQVITADRHALPRQGWRDLAAALDLT